MVEPVVLADAAWVEHIQLFYKPQLVLHILILCDISHTFAWLNVREASILASVL
jgi:hypothetical protein